MKADDDRAVAIADAMRVHGTIEIESHVAAWRVPGRSGFDEAAQPCPHEQVERERLADGTDGRRRSTAARTPTRAAAR